MLSGTEGSAGVMQEYSKYTFRRIAFISLFIVIVILLFLVSLTAGTRDLSIGEVYGYLFDHLTGVVYDKETQYEMWFDENTARFRDYLTRSSVDSVSVRTDQDYVKALMSLFARRN